jgi:ribonuclease BN (tRNA processing enzyme)
VQIVLLGSGGWIPTGERETCCAYVRSGSQALAIDAGTGLRRLIEKPELLDGVRRLDVVLTHFHLDHVVGLSYLPALGLRPRIWGGGMRLAGRPTSELLERLLGAPFFGAPLSELADEICEVGDDPFDIGAFRVETRIQLRHAHPTLALRLGGLVYCTDTAADPLNAEFAAHADLLCHDAWTPDDGDENHASAAEAARLARDSGSRRLVLIHVNPLRTDTAELLSAARGVFADTTLGVDLWESAFDY